MSVQLVFSFPIDATFEQVSAEVALHFGGVPVNLSTGEADLAPLRDASAVFTGSTVATISTGATPESTPPGTVERDIHGLPWDERIHSSSKNRNADGSWRGRKGVPPPTIAKVKAELLAQSNGGAVPTAAVTTGTAVAPAASQVSMQADGADARAARIAYAHDQATIKVGPNRLLSQDQFEKLQAGHLVEVSPQANAWFDSWKAAVNEAYVEYGKQAEAQSAAAVSPGPGTVATPTPTPTPTPAGLDPNSFAGFCAWQAGKVAPDVLNGVLSTLGINGGLGALVTQEAMIPAVRALLAAQGIA
jgi:hypothetical protein